MELAKDYVVFDMKVDKTKSGKLYIKSMHAIKVINHYPEDEEFNFDATQTPLKDISAEKEIFTKLKNFIANYTIICINENVYFDLQEKLNLLFAQTLNNDFINFSGLKKGAEIQKMPIPEGVPEWIPNPFRLFLDYAGIADKYSEV